MLPSTLAILAAFLPPIAAWRAHRSFVRDPAGQVGACWLVMGLAGLVEATVFYQGIRVPAYVNMAVTGAFPLLLLPPLLTWLGPAWKRWQWPALVAWLALWLATTRVWTDGRQFKMIVDSSMAVAMCALSAAALAAQVRRQSSAPVRSDWFWILTAHVMYFATNIFRQPLVEALVARHWDAALAVGQSILLLYVVIYVLIARGMLLPSTARTPLRSAGPVGQAA